MQSSVDTSDDDIVLSRLKKSDEIQSEKSEDSEKDNGKSKNAVQATPESATTEKPKRPRKRRSTNFSNTRGTQRKKPPVVVAPVETESDALPGGEDSLMSMPAESVENSGDAASPLSRTPTPPPQLDCDYNSYSPFQLMLATLLKIFEKKDKDDYFKYPVTDKLAPNYSDVVQRPMDFYHMRIKVKDNVYGSLDEFKADALLLCSNANLYNAPDTCYSQAARKMMSIINQLTSKDKLSHLAKSLPFIAKISPSLIGFKLNVDKLVSPRKKFRTGYHEAVDDNMSSDEILAVAERASARARSKLMARAAKTNVNVGTLKQNKDGSVALKFLPPRCGVPQAEGEERNVPTFGNLIGKLKSGTPGLPTFLEEKRNYVVPVKPLDYGPFASFAPQYDSTWATISKEESAILLSTYGNVEAAQYACSIQEYVNDSGNYLVRMVDNLLDILTDGKHSENMEPAAERKKVEESEKEAIATVPVDSPQPGTSSAPNPDQSIDINSLRSLSSLGINVSFLDQLETQGIPPHPSQPGHLHSNQAYQRANGEMLYATGQMLHDLSAQQYQRLSHPPPFTLSHAPGPGDGEITLAENIVGNLSELSNRVAPGQLVQPQQVHQLIGFQAPLAQISVDTELHNELGIDEPKSSDGINMELLNEFLQG